LSRLCSCLCRCFHICYTTCMLMLKTLKALTGAALLSTPAPTAVAKLSALMGLLTWKRLPGFNHPETAARLQHAGMWLDHVIKV